MMPIADSEDSCSFRSRDLAGPALRAFFNIAVKWDLSSEQSRRLLGSPPRSNFYRWKRTKSGRLAPSVIERVSYILRIYAALHEIFPNESQANSWLKRPNSASIFGGRPALDLLLSGHLDALRLVQGYLDSQRS